MSAPYTIHTSTLFDPKKKEFVSDTSITVDPVSGLIIEVIKRTPEFLGSSVPAGDVDLRGKIVMPGFVDAHSHIFLHSYDERPSLNQKRDESVVERIVRAVIHCRTALLSGYTTYRDLGSESMQEGDAQMRDCINRGLIPGPRLFVATRALASTGSYEPRTENHANGVCLPRGGETVDGADEARTAVRRRLAAGADIIKFFADYRRRIMRYPPAQQHPYVQSVTHPPANPNPDLLVFAQEEMDMIVKEAKIGQAPVACHAGTIEGAIMAVKAGVNSIEHAYFANQELFELMIEKNCMLVPTLAVCERLHKGRFKEILAQTKLAYDLGVRFACGGDTGTYPHGQNAREMELMIEAGLPLEDVLESCTVGGWESCGKDLCGMRFGWFEKGLRADIIALRTDPREDKFALRKVDFVMKDGVVWKQEGQGVGIYLDDHKWDTD
ncbi:amidohydrolase domain-containing protein [Penicillium riverlandense]|uniref:amidohydrolase domain-containing protein n=1 Tax=Penicillium riverlandense TaxID=1903569 RepID=UPI0025482632|nr:amidohydrolase domain-containing protein [Penicillium riverlandense]KAJ5812674.1 amidohydrolase domain-containing protein [Penicillium riverlandense]